MPKKSFVLYMDQYDPIKKLTMEQRGELLTAIFSYHAEEEYKIKDPLVDMAFSFFEQTFKRDCEKWKRSAGRSRENGKKGGRPKGSKNKALDENPENPVGLLETQKNPGEPKKPVSVSVSVSESVSASEKKEKNITDAEKKKFSKDVINKLNELTGKNFRHTDTNLGFIKARLNQDPNLVMEDFEKVIKVKMKDDYFIENNGKYLRPQTLFGTKFDTYLNECIDLKVTKKPDNKPEHNQLGAAYQEWNGGNY